MANLNSYSDSGLTAGTAYYYEISAVSSGASWESGKSVSVSAIPPNPWVPSAPLEHVGQMRLIHAATPYSFTMGSNDTLDDSAQPPHYVSFANDFYIDTTEVTQADYLALADSAALIPINLTKLNVCDSCPVQGVSWFYAVLYCNARSKRDSLDTVYTYVSAPGNAILFANGNNGFTYLAAHFSNNGYRLPTEAEWEYACRGGTTTPFFWGNDTAAAVVEKYCVYGNYSGYPSPTATKLPNAYGLYDMSGGVWEWCNDWFGDYSAGSQVDPTGLSSGTMCVLRGGSSQNSYGRGVNDLRSASRLGTDPLLTYSNPGYTGFRCVRRY